MEVGVRAGGAGRAGADGAGQSAREGGRGAAASRRASRRGRLAADVRGGDVGRPDEFQLGAAGAGRPACARRSCSCPSSSRPLSAWALWAFARGRARGAAVRARPCSRSTSSLWGQSSGWRTGEPRTRRRAVARARDRQTPARSAAQDHVVLQNPDRAARVRPGDRARAALGLALAGVVALDAAGHVHDARHPERGRLRRLRPGALQPARGRHEGLGRTDRPRAGLCAARAARSTCSTCATSSRCVRRQSGRRPTFG